MCSCASPKKRAVVVVEQAKHIEAMLPSWVDDQVLMGLQGSWYEVCPGADERILEVCND